MACVAAAAQTPPPEVTFRADSSLALLGFHVMKNGAFVDDLRPEEIEVREQGNPRPVAVFEGGMHFARNIPVELMLLFDASGSIRNSGLLNPQVFDAEVLAQHPQVSVSVYAFTHEWNLLTTPTRDIAVLNRAAAEVLEMPPGGTRLYEAVVQTVAEASARAGRATRALVIFSDSIAPREREAEAIRSAHDAGVTVYPVVLGAPPPPRLTASVPHPLEVTVADFVRLGSATGGREFRAVVPGPAVFDQVLDWILHQIGAEYVAGIYPEWKGGDPVRLEVTLRDRSRGELVGGSRVLGKPR